METGSDFIPGVYPLITRRDPLQKGGGQDNLGMGYTQHGEQFMLKAGGAVGVAEFVGARIADVCGIPACQPTIVTIEDWANGSQNVFGSRIESGVAAFDQTQPLLWQQVAANCLNPDVFSAMFAIDLVLGNDDRHWYNWIVQGVKDSDGQEKWRLRALDFSRSWPVRHPPQHPLRHHSTRTWEATANWELLGIAFDRGVFDRTCVKIASLHGRWLNDHVLHPLKGVFLTAEEAGAYCRWWDESLQDQIVEAIQTLENGGRP